MVESNSEFRTSDTPLAAYLVQAGFNLIIIEYEDKRNGKQRANFIFEDNTKLRELVSLFNRGEATINLALYEHAKSTLLDRIMRGLP
ncbi:MAG: DUF5659 domain-containing protein [Dehalococcoidales bacterium]|jgi:hypothetical protein|nr:DUF5659 domain-containing protein [Dehalococcoidales bacterium]